MQDRSSNIIDSNHPDHLRDELPEECPVDDIGDTLLKWVTNREDDKDEFIQK